MDVAIRRNPLPNLKPLPTMSDITNAQNWDIFVKGLWKENPVFVAVLGMCPTLAVTNTAINSLAMGGATTFVLFFSSLLVSLLRKAIAKQVRITTYIVIIATFVSLIDMLLAAFLPDIHKELGAFIALIVVNCVILGRQEAFAAKNNVGRSMLDALGMGLGFSMALLMIGVIREVLGSGSLFGVDLLGASFEPWVVMILPPGGFFTLGFLLLIFNGIARRRMAKASIQTL